MRALILGLGSIGLRHARNLRQLGVTNLAGVDPNPESRAKFTAEMGAEAYETLAAALQVSAQLGVIASPNRFHIDQALACAQAGLHLFIEKPLGIALQDVDRLEGLIATRRLFAHVGSNWKFHPAFQQMKQLLVKGALGRLVGFRVLAGQWLPDWHPYEDYRQMYAARSDLGGGIVFDTHELDYLLWLFGDLTSVLGIAGSSGSLEIDTPDVVSAALRFESGIQGVLQADYIQRQVRRDYHIYGSEGSLDWDIRTGRIVVTRSKSHPEPQSEFDVSVADLNEMYVDQMRHVLNGISNSSAPVTPVSAAKRVLQAQVSLMSTFVPHMPRPDSRTSTGMN